MGEPGDELEDVLRRSLTRYAGHRDELGDPVPGVAAGMRRRRRRRTAVWSGAAVLALVVASGLGVVVGESSADRPAPSQLSGTPTARPSTDASEIATSPAPAGGGDAQLTGFQAQDLTFVSTTRGWALGTVPCGSARCELVAATEDGGVSWQPRGRPPGAPVGLRFADLRVGYAYGYDGLSLSRDGGRSWQRVDRTMTATVEASGGTVLRLGPDCVNGCVFARATVGSTSFTPLRLPRPGLSASAALRRQGRDTYVVSGPNVAGCCEARATVFHSEDDGDTWSTTPDPCSAPGQPEVDASLPATAPGGVLVVVCTDRQDRRPRAVRVSSDGGAHFGPARALPAGSVAAITAASADDVLVHLDRDGRSDLLRTTDGGRSWQQVATETEPAGVPHTLDPTGGPFLGLTSAAVGSWLGADPTVVQRTNDGGATWTAHRFGPAGAAAVLVDATCGGAAYEPDVVDLVCDRGHLVLGKLVWGSWTATRATGRGAVLVTGCGGPCPPVRPAQVVLDEASDGRFRRLVLTYQGGDSETWRPDPHGGWDRQ